MCCEFVRVCVGLHKKKCFSRFFKWMSLVNPVYRIKASDLGAVDLKQTTNQYFVSAEYLELYFVLFIGLKMCNTKPRLLSKRSCFFFFSTDASKTFSMLFANSPWARSTWWRIDCSLTPLSGEVNQIKSEDQDVLVDISHHSSHLSQEVCECLPALTEGVAIYI